MSTITSWIKINENGISRNGVPLLSKEQTTTPEDAYRSLQCNYPKFFKMDVLCKWAIVGADALLQSNNQSLIEGYDKTKIAVVLVTKQGCLEVDKRYLQSAQEIASPALFVYTLANIMLGEICIQYGFKGEQTCMVQDNFDTTELNFWVNDLMTNRGMDACLCGWVDANNSDKDVYLTWVTKK